MVDFKQPLPVIKRRNSNSKNSDPEIFREDNKLLKLDENIDEHSQEFSSTILKRLLLSLQKKININQELRIKYPEQPEKFMESEIELYEEIQNFSVLATAPDLLPEFIESKVFTLTIQLLAHENADISSAVVQLFFELTDDEVLTDFPDEANTLIEALVKDNFILLLYQNIIRMDEKNADDSTCVHSTLGILENFTSLEPKLCETIVDSSEFLPWLLGRIRVKQFDQNKLYASEILSILLHHGEIISRKLGEMGGIDSLLRSLAHYRNKDPKDSEEIELLNNLFDSLCSCLLVKENKKHFLQEEGIELLIIMLKEKKMASVGAVKVLNYCFTGGNEFEACKKFVDQFGLKSLFPKFMKPPKKFIKGLEVNDFEESVVCIIYDMLRAFSENSAYKTRVLGKFIESDMIKIERLVELHEKYFEQIQKCRKAIEAEKMELQLEGKKLTEYDTARFEMKEYDAGLNTLRLVDYLLCYLCASEVPEFQVRIYKLFDQKQKRITEFLATLEDNIKDLENASTEDTDKAARDVKAMKELLLKIKR
ncbi:beta-catenin-like protein 1 [Zophobas morio]|uniref:beta-catenin-like protein 1 n=1 Tax=Zophobas morio TaxID=2755281 RepID=UPI003082E53B